MIRTKHLFFLVVFVLLAGCLPFSLAPATVIITGTVEQVVDFGGALLVYSGGAVIAMTQVGDDGTFAFEVNKGDHELVLEGSFISSGVRYVINSIVTPDKDTSLTISGLSLGEPIISSMFNADIDLDRWDKAVFTLTSSFGGEGESAGQMNVKDWTSLNLDVEQSAGIWTAMFYDDLDNTREFWLRANATTDGKARIVYAGVGKGNNWPVDMTTYVLNEYQWTGTEAKENIIDTGISRTEGWHELRYIFEANRLVIKLDEVIVYDETDIWQGAVTSSLSVGSWWGSQVTGVIDAVQFYPVD